MSSTEELGLCRVCANPFEGSAMFRLFDEAVGPLALAEIFLQVAGIVADARLPSSCCDRCRNRLQEVEDLRALCQESDRKLRKMIGIEVKEEEPDEEHNGGSVEAHLPKVEMIELPESYSYWEDAENRLSSSEDDSDPEYVAKGAKVRKTRNSRKQLKAETNRSKNLRRSTRENLSTKPEETANSLEKPEKEIITEGEPENQESGHSSDDFDRDDSDPDFKEEKPQNAEKKLKKSTDKPKGERKKRRTSEPKPKPPKDAKIFQCAWCGRFFKTNHNLKEHETTHSSEKPLKCHICPKEFARRDYYKRHLKMHETEGQFKCNECDKAFHCNKRLENHISVKHRGERPFQCTLCPKAYPSASSLYGHVQTFHEKKQPFKCDVCLRTFYSKYILDRHKMKHKGIKSSQCPHCDKKYESNNYLHQHIAERHPEKAGNISRCLYCGLGYTTDSHYRKHVAKKHPEHLAELDQVLKAKRESLNNGT